MVLGYDVLLYSVDDNDLSYQTNFPFPDPIESIEVKSGGLVVTTAYDWYSIAGGPSLATYFSMLLARRSPGTVLTGNGIVRVA